MAYTEWNPEWATGNELMDNQHQQLIAAVNNLFEAQKSGKGREAVKRTMDFLIDYTVKHFSDEEELQKKYDYPYYSEHKQIHDNFKNSANELLDTLHREGPTDEFVKHICLTIGRWVINHIKHEDFKMAAYIHDKDQEE